MKFVPVSKWVSHTFSAISVRVRILSGFWTKKRSKLYSFGVSIMDCPFRETDFVLRYTLRSAYSMHSTVGIWQRFSRIDMRAFSSQKSKGLTI